MALKYHVFLLINWWSLLSWIAHVHVCVIYFENIYWLCLTERNIILFFQEKFDLGEIMVSLCYLPTAGRLTLTIIKARNLKAMDITGSSGKWVNTVIHLFSIYFKGFYSSTSQTTPISITLCEIKYTTDGTFGLEVYEWYKIFFIWCKWNVHN